MKQMKQKKSKKEESKKWVCEVCDFVTSKKSNLIRHLSTTKHLFETNEAEKKKKISTTCMYCNKFLKSRTTLWRHNKECRNPINPINPINLGNVEKSVIQNKTVQNLLSKLEKKDKEQEKLWTAFNEQQKLLKQTIEQNSKILPRMGNNNNNQISINVILNEKCKNAMNLEDFVEKLQVSIEDLNYTKENGYVKGLSNIMVKHLKNLEPNCRPIHCTDQNNMHFYVKEENTWEKDDKNKKVSKSINEIQRKQVLKIKDWTDSHPNYCTDDSLYIEYQKMIKSAMCVDTNDNLDIEKNISNIVNISDVCN